MTIAAPTDDDVFRAYEAQVLCRKLRPGDVVVLDKLAARKVSGIAELITACGAQLLYLPSYSPEFSPAEQAWSKFKQLLPTAKVRSAEALEQAITQALQTIPP